MKKIKFTLFFKIAIIILLTLSVTNFLTASLSMKIAERLFLQSFTLLNQKIFDQTAEKLTGINLQVLEMIRTSRQNTALRQYLTAQPKGELERYQLMYRLSNSFSVLRQTGNYLTDTSFLGKNNILLNLSSDTSPPLTADEVAAHEFTEITRSNPEKLSYIYCDSKFIDNPEEKPIIIAARQLTSIPDTQFFGTIYITMEESRFSETYENVISQGSDVLVLNTEGRVVSSNLKEKLGSYEPELLELAVDSVANLLEYSSILRDGEIQIMISHYLPAYDMYMVNLVSRDDMMHDFYLIKPTVFGICAIAVLGGIVAAFWVTRRISRPLVSLINHMQQAKDGNFVKAVQTGDSYEVLELQQHYNIMVDEIDNYIRKLVQEQTERRKLEIEALQMQITPHFLYNTLASVKYLSWQNDTQAVTEMINALITLLQNTIGKMEEEIPLSEEFENIKSYITINRLRYGEGIRVSYSADEGCLDCMLPKMVVQPFIENAYFHAFQNKREGCIRVFFYRSGGNLVCEVIDDGDGISKRKQDSLFDVRHEEIRFSGIGIKNVDQRLKLIYGQDYGVSVASEEGAGTIVTITMKYRQNEVNNE